MRFSFNAADTSLFAPLIQSLLIRALKGLSGSGKVGLLSLKYFSNAMCSALVASLLQWRISKKNMKNVKHIGSSGHSVSNSTRFKNGYVGCEYKTAEMLQICFVHRIFVGKTFVVES